MSHPFLSLTGGCDMSDGDTQSNRLQMRAREMRDPKDDEKVEGEVVEEGVAD